MSMTRLDTQSSQQAVTIKHLNKTNKACRISYVVILASFLVITYLIVSKPNDSLGDPSDQFVVKTIPKLYTTLDSESTDDREVFEGFCTSFLPAEELFSADSNKRKREVYEGNVTSDILIWGETDKQRPPTRVKRMSRFTFTSKGNDKHDRRRRSYDDGSGDGGHERQDTDYDSDQSEMEYESSEPSAETEYNDDQDLQRAIHPEPHVDRGPLDDVVEQVRGQPELEEEEMMASAYAYKHGRPYKGIHAFWKGQGDRETIRKTQAKIMRQYMDAEADPCHDFYQYACGNWPALNPIPADKAGYDTFEMLRENLDSVLKDLLELKHHETIHCKYPGAHLDLDENVLESFLPSSYPEDEPVNPDPEGGEGTDIENILLDALGLKTSEENQTLKIHHAVIKTHKNDKSKIIERIRRYLDTKTKQLEKKAKKLFHYKRKTIPPQSRVKRYSRRSSYGTNKYKRLEENPLSIHHKHKTQENPLSIHYKHKTRPVTRLKFKRYRRSLNLENHNNIGNIVMSSSSVRFGRKLLMFKKRRKSISAEKFTSPRIKSKRQTEMTADETDKVLNIEKENLDPSGGDAAKKARFLFKSCMNYEILQKRGHQPLLDLLDLFGGWPILNPKWDGENFDWLELMAKLRLYNNDILISEWVGPDIKNSDEFVIQFDQTSLGLPTRDYFLQDSNKVYLNAYKDYLNKIAVLLGGNPRHVRISADKLIDFETSLAKITSAPEDRRNVSELYRRMPLYVLEELVPEVKWRRYLCVVMNRTVHRNETVVMFALNYVRHLVQLMKHTDASVLSNYLLWRFVRHRVNNLDDRFQSAKQQFYFVLFGREQAPPRWKNCISQVNSNMGMALGSMFVRNYFDETSKNDTLTMTREIQKSFKELLHKTDWIDEKTKQLAAHKIDAMMLRIGYPDFILNKAELDDRYKEVMIHPDKYFENILNILQHLTKMEQGRLGQPVNKTLWNTAPAVVNAYYSRNKNQIMFPAGILQPPFYHRHFPRSLNYGGIGVVIGHEITHGFDDKGRLFDSDGNLHRWWSDSAIEAFHRRAQCLIDQYGHYVVPEVNVKLDGVNTQGENIADNGGVKQAFRAYLHWLQHHGSADETLPGLNHTHTQLFFLNFAQVWCGAMRPEAMRNKLKTAVHSPGRFRVIGTLSNSHDFAREFRCPPGSPMNPTQKCSVW